MNKTMRCGMCWKCFAVFRFKINLSLILVLSKRLHLNNSKKLRHKEKKQIRDEGVHDNASAFIEK